MLERYCAEFVRRLSDRKAPWNYPLPYLYDDKPLLILGINTWILAPHSLDSPYWRRSDKSVITILKRARDGWEEFGVEQVSYLGKKKLVAWDNVHRLDVMVIRGGRKAYYERYYDRIRIPDSSKLEKNIYQSFLSHELIHWALSRLARQKGKIRMDLSDSAEELVCILGAAYLANLFGFQYHCDIDDVGDHIPEWTQKIESDPFYLLRICDLASRAFLYVKDGISAKSVASH